MNLFILLLLLLLAGILIVILVNVILEIISCKKQGLHLAKMAKLPKKISAFKRLFVLFPRQIVNDLFNRQDYEFLENGFHLFVGEQGSGKTITLVYMLLQMQKKYPKMLVRTNMGYKYENGTINSWKDLVFKNNGIYGQIDVIDEVQNWFNSLQSKDFPPEMFSEITQQRKQRKCIYGTSQVWGRVAKPIREQVAFVYKPCTIFGCLTIVRKFKPNVDDEGTIDKLEPRGMFFFIHNAEIRNAFDTYKKIQVQSLKGYKSENEQIRSVSALPSGSDGQTVVISALKG